MMPRNITATFEDDIIPRRYALPTLARSTPFNRAISCELKSLLNHSILSETKKIAPSCRKKRTRQRYAFRGAPYHYLAFECVSPDGSWICCTDKKEKKIFLIYKEIQLQSLL
jgi:hypothetical protein